MCVCVCVYVRAKDERVKVPKQLLRKTFDSKKRYYDVRKGADRLAKKKNQKC